MTWKQHNNTTEPSGEAYQHFSKMCAGIKFVKSKRMTKINKAVTAAKSFISQRTYSETWLFSQEISYQIQSWHRETNCDIIHFDTISLAPYRDIFTNEDCILNHHNIESQMLIRRAKKCRNPFLALYFYIEGRRLKSYEREITKQFALHIFCSSLDKDRFSRIASTRSSEVIPNGVDLTYFTPSGDIAEIAKSLIFIGGLTWYPNAAAMIYFSKRIWPKIKKMDNDISIQIIGRGRIKKLDLIARNDPNYTLKGFVDDIRPNMESASIYVCPITDGGGTKLKILDALAMGKALVAHPVACEGIPLVHEHNVLMADSEDEFAAAIYRLIHDEQLRKKLGVNGRLLIENQFDYSKIGEKYANILDKIASGYLP